MVAESGNGLTHEEIQAAEGLLRFIEEAPVHFTRYPLCVLGLMKRGSFIFLKHRYGAASQEGATTRCAMGRASLPLKWVVPYRKAIIFRLPLRILIRPSSKSRLIPIWKALVHIDA